MSAMEDYDMTEADADVEDEPTLSPNGRVRGQRHHAAHGLRPRQRSQRGSFASDTPDDLDPDADTKHSSPRSTPKQRRSSSSSDAGKRSRGGGGLGGGGGGHGRKKSGTVDLNTIRQALERTLKSEEWDDTLLLLGTKDLNACLKGANYSKDQINQLKIARRRAKNRTYALRSRQKKSGKVLSPCPGPTGPISGASADTSVRVKQEHGVDVADAAGGVYRGGDSEGAAAAMHGASRTYDQEAYEIEALGQELMGLDTESNNDPFDDDESEQWESSSSYSSSFEGFSSSTTASYDNQFDLMSSLNQRDAAIAFDLGAMSLEPFPQPPKDNFTACMMANVPDDRFRGGRGGALSPAASAAPGGSVVDGWMSELENITTAYKEVHTKLDTLQGELVPDHPDRHRTVTDEPLKSPVMAARERALASRAQEQPGHGRTTPTNGDIGEEADGEANRTNSGLQSMSEKIDGWTGMLDLPPTPDAQQLLTPSGPSPTTAFVNRFAGVPTPTTLAALAGATAFTFDGPQAYAEAAAAAAARDSHNHQFG